MVKQSVVSEGYVVETGCGRKGRGVWGGTGLASFPGLPR